MNHIMIDIETLGVNHNAAIVSIGACQFDLYTGKIGNTFYINIDLQSCIDSGLTLTASTIMWWMAKDKEAQQALIGDQVDLDTALACFSEWLNRINAAGCEIWANSPSFDCVILKNAFEACRMPLPWNYWNERDCRTLVSFAPWIKKSMVNELAHDALSDCKYQVAYCSAIWNSININK